MIYDFTKGKSAQYFSSLIEIKYDFDFSEFNLSLAELEFDKIGYLTRDKKNGFTRLGAYLPEFSNVKYRANPVLHIFTCDTKTDLSRRMKVTNSSRNTFYSRDTKENVTTTLEICKKCARNLRDQHKIKMGLYNFNNFILALEENERTRMKICDNNGYMINWRQISFVYRDSKKFICENCGFKATTDQQRKFIHTHHIDGNKKNNYRQNLKCLCIKCHSEVDNYHRDKFALEGLNQLIIFQDLIENQKKTN